MKEEKDYFEIMRKIQKKPEASQRQLAGELGFSLGKLNYCLKALQQKGLIKIKNFKKILKIKLSLCSHPEGIATKTRLTINFMKKKLKNMTT